MASFNDDFGDLGVHIALISPQPLSRSAKLAAKYDACGNVDFLIDEGGVAARKLKIEMTDGVPFGMSVLGYAKDTVYTTVTLIDAEGSIIHTDQTDNYRVRPEPQTFLRIFRKQLAEPN